MANLKLNRLSQAFAHFGYLIFFLIVSELLLQNVASHILRYRQSKTSASSPDDLTATMTDRSHSSAFKDFPWREEFWIEENERENLPGLSFDPYRAWRLKEFHGKYVNVDQDGKVYLRRTLNPTNETCSRKRTQQVWMFGGSALWGWNNPDFATIPSLLSQRLNQSSDTCFIVTNFGVLGYNSTQQLIHLIEELKIRPPPDQVVFFDGANDAYVGTERVLFSPLLEQAYDQTLKFSIHSALGQWWKNTPLEKLGWEAKKGLANRFPSWGLNLMGPDNFTLPRTAAGLLKAQEQATEDLSGYLKNLAMARVLAHNVGFKITTFVQPVAFYPDPPETPAFGNYSKVNAFYRGLDKESKKNRSIVFLGGLFHETQHTDLIDWCHPGPHGNERIAKVMAETIESRNVRRLE